MRWLGFSVFLWFFHFQLSGETLRITTWNLQWFPHGTPQPASAEVQSNRIAAAAQVIQKLSPDILLLQEIEDWESVNRLVVALRPETYHVAVCSVFSNRVFKTRERQQVAILAKRPAELAWAEPWKTTSFGDPPRGFAFATFVYGTNRLAVYTVHLKSNLTRGSAEKETQMNILKRELAVDQLLQHNRDVQEKLPSPSNIFIAGGDFNTNPDNLRFVSERTLTILNDNGYRSGFAGIPHLARITCPGKGVYPDATFDYVFVKGAPQLRRPLIEITTASDHYAVTVTVELGNGRP